MPEMRTGGGRFSGGISSCISMVCPALSLWAKAAGIAGLSRTSARARSISGSLGRIGVLPLYPHRQFDGWTEVMEPVFERCVIAPDDVGSLPGHGFDATATEDFVALGVEAVGAAGDG